MLLAFALYAVTLALVIGGVAVLLHRAALLLRLPTRVIWIAAMVALVVAPPLMVSRRASPAPVAVTVLAMPERSSVPTGSAPSSTAATATPMAAMPDGEPLHMRIAMRMASAWHTVLTWVATTTQAFDGALAMSWVLLSVGCAVAALRTRRRLERLTQLLPTRDVAGQPLRVSEDIGPAAIGGRARAIVLPAWVLELDHALLQLVVRHEREHLTARDPQLLALGLLFVVLMPWHPAIWWAWHRLRLAIELDCDARVLRDAPSPRRYAQLLLFMSQQPRPGRSKGWRSSLALPFAHPLMLTFNPQRSHLTTRINAMTMRPSRRPLRVAGLLAGVAAVATLAGAVPSPALWAFESAQRLAGVTPSRPALVKVSSVKLFFEGARVIGIADSLQVVVYRERGPVRIGLGTNAPTLVGDTLRLNHLPAFTADVTDGDVHVELRGVRGMLELGAEVEAGPATRYTVRGRHVILRQGGTGVGTALPTVSPETRPVDLDAFRSELAGRKAAYELMRADLLATYSPTFAMLRDVERELTTLDSTLRVQPEATRKAVMGEVMRTLTTRIEALDAGWWPGPPEAEPADQAKRRQEEMRHLLMLRRGELSRTWNVPIWSRKTP